MSNRYDNQNSVFTAPVIAPIIVFSIFVFLFFYCMKDEKERKEKAIAKEKLEQSCAVEFKSGLCSQQCFDFISYESRYTGMLYNFEFRGVTVPCSCFVNVPSGKAPIRCLNQKP